MGVVCSYCGENAILTTGDQIYGSLHRLRNEKLWVCFQCDAWVGCHKRNKRHGHKGDEPLGRLANRELRKAKIRAHDAFDRLWRKRGAQRRDSYKWLANKMGIRQEECHIGMFDEEQCMQVVEIIEKLFGSNGT